VIRLGGLVFAVEPEDRLIDSERRSLARLGAAAAERAPYRLTLEREPPWSSDDLSLFPERGPAVVDWVEGRVRVSHATFVAELDPRERFGRLFRKVDEAYPLEITLRTALASRLPLEGGVPLHAAGIVLEDGRSVAFFGPSGAGKSTLAGTSRDPVLSDELVALVPGPPFALEATGFWGTLGQGDAPPGTFPLAALVELAKGDRFALERIDPKIALRRLVGVTLVPVGPPLWDAALGVLGRLAVAVPCYRMAWSKDEPPWEGLRAGLRPLLSSRT
jgi:hypothetical protein